MSKNVKKLIVCIAIPLLVGAISSVLTRGEMKNFEALNQPALSPPGWLFPVVWIILYTLMGVASYFICISNASEEQRGKALLLYGVQLAFNFFWPLIFFNLKAYLFAFVWIVILWVLIVLTMKSFYKISKVACYLLIPYIGWVTFAAYLNLGIYILN